MKRVKNNNNSHRSLILDNNKLVIHQCNSIPSGTATTTIVIAIIKAVKISNKVATLKGPGTRTKLGCPGI
jgi:hypothetical protein